MARPCISKTKKSTSMRNLNEDENASTICKFKLNRPPVFQSYGFLNKAKQFEKKADEKINQELTSERKLKFQCHYEERKKRTELRRRKIIQKLKKNYNIDVEDLKEDVVREIILKIETLEKEKKKREKANIERMMIIITKLLEEQKYKNRGNKVYHPFWKKISKCFPQTACKEKEDKTVAKGENEPRHVGEFGIKCYIRKQTEISEEKAPSQTESSVKQKITIKSTEEFSLKEQSEQFIQKEETEKLSKCEEIKKKDSIERQLSETDIEELRAPQCISIERCLESTPKVVVFQDYEKNKVYLQELKITNIGLEIIHCRYLGIIVHTKCEERFPIGVAVRDNIKLRPGLCCSTKIRLCSQDDTKELQCSVVYETRRKNEPLQHSIFFVQVICLPVRAVVNVTPLKITFPSLTWCEATGSENAKGVKKILKIKNSGGKTCSCKITNISLESNIVEENAEEEELGEAGEEADSLKTISNTEKDSDSNMKFMKGEDYPGKDYMYPCREYVEMTELIVNELVENIFAAFRFSPKFYIKIPPFSTTQIEIRFIPHYKGFHHEKHFINFENCDNCKEVAIELTGDIKRIPLRVEPQVIDLKTCIANSGVYAETFKIFNESKGPYAVYLKVPSSVRKHVHVHPRATTILPFNYSDFSVRIYPRVSLAKDAPRYYKEDLQIFEFPVFIHPANVGDCKGDYLIIYVFALITDYCLQLSPSFINFGAVTTLETVRTELELTNHSFALQEYGFLRLPKGVRVEPNMGFGKILPKESITLYLLYSPGEDLLGYGNTEDVHEFQIAVTSIAKYGGLKEKLEPEEETPKSFDLFWGEGCSYEMLTPKVSAYSEEQCLLNLPEYSDDFGVCEEDSSIEDEEICLKIYEEEKKIREFLKRDGDKMSELSFFKRMDVKKQDCQSLKESEDENRGESFSEFGEFEKSELQKSDVHVVNCRAVIVQPRCQISESVIQLPATPCTSFSLYRFRLSANNEAGDRNCYCGFRKVSKQSGRNSRFQGSFEFQYFCPHIKLEPESGFIKAGDNLPITVIYRPEFPAEHLRQQSRIKKAENSRPEKNVTPVSFSDKDEKVKKKPSNTKIKSKVVIPENAVEDIIDVSFFELENYDLFAGERSLQELISPFYVETKVTCIIKTTENGSQNERTEIHELVLICPAIKPNFIYLGKSQEIKFNKVFIGTMSKILLQIQNISFERISPSITLLNPAGAFYCPAGTWKVEVDPEHVWRQALTYRPLKDKGIEKQFFEVFCGSTNIFLTISGEGIRPEYKITPNFACCLIEAKPGVLEEIKLEIENLSEIKLNLSLQTKFLKEGPDLEKGENIEEEPKVRKEKAGEKEETKDKMKSKNSASDKNVWFWEEIPEAISSTLENLTDIKDGEFTPKIFTLAGVNENNEVLIPPSGRLQIKIQIMLTADKIGRIFATKYVLMLEKVSPLKEIIVLANTLKGK